MAFVLDKDHPIILMSVEILADKVSEYKAAFEAREGSKTSLTLRRALAIEPNEEESDSLESLSDFVLSMQEEAIEGRHAIYYAHVSKTLQTLADKFKEFAELHIQDLPSDHKNDMSEDDLIELKDQCDYLFQTIVGQTGDPNATRQRFTNSGKGGKGFKLDIPRFQKSKDKGVTSTTSTLIINGTYFKTLTEACREAFSIKGSEFIQLVKDQNHVYEVGNKFDFEFDEATWKVEIVEAKKEETVETV